MIKKIQHNGDTVFSQISDIFNKHRNQSQTLEQFLNCGNFKLKIKN